jgi:hypothetical protein
MADLFSSFSSRVSTLSATPSAPANSGSGFLGTGINIGEKAEATVKDQTGTGFWANLFGIGKSEKRVEIQPQGNDRASLTVRDDTGVGAFDLATGNSPERRFNATQVGSKVVVQETANSGDSAFNIATGNTAGKSVEWY